MASICPHSTGGFKVRFYIYFPDGRKEEKSRYRKSKTEAQALKQDADRLEAITMHGGIKYDELTYFRHRGVITEEEAHRITGGKDLTPVTWALLRKLYETYSDSAHTAHNRKTIRSRLKNLDEHFADGPIHEITVDRILEWQALRLKGVAAKTVKHERDVINQILDIAVDRGAIPFNPGRHRRLKGTLRIDRSRLPVALSYEQVKALFEAIKEKPHLLGGKIYLATLLCLFAGLRRGELCYLTKDDIRGSTVIVQSKNVKKEETSDADVLGPGRWIPKGNRARTIELPEAVAVRVHALVDSGDRFIFGGARVYSRDYLSQEFNEVIKPAAPGLSLHCLRHTFVTWRIEHGLSGKGDNLVRVQAAAGHANIQTTMRYTHIKMNPEKDIYDLAR